MWPERNVFGLQISVVAAHRKGGSRSIFARSGLKIKLLEESGNFRESNILKRQKQ